MKEDKEGNVISVVRELLSLSEFNPDTSLLFLFSTTSECTGESIEHEHGNGPAWVMWQPRS